MRDGKPSLPGLFLHSVDEYGLNTYCVPHRAGDAGPVTANKSVTPHGVHDKEAAGVSQKGKEAQSMGMCEGHLPETWRKETGVSAEWGRERFWLREEDVQRSSRDGRAGQGGGSSSSQKGEFRLGEARQRKPLWALNKP